MTSAKADEIRARIAAVIALLDAMPATPHTHELKAKAETYRWTVEQWVSIGVSAAQQLALRELVEELHVKVTRGSIPDLSPSSPQSPLSTPTAWTARQTPPKKRS